MTKHTKRDGCRTEAKLVDREKAALLAAAARKAGKCVGFTSGVVDLVHPGQVEYLEDARAECDLLIVAVNSDSSVRALKGPQRPICAEQDRARVVAGLASVDFVFLFSEETNAQNVKLIQPSLYLKAGEYRERGLTSAKLVEELGGTVRYVPYRAGSSSSSLIERVRAAYPEPVAAPPVFATTPQPAIFVDRDGVLNEEVEYLHDPEKVRIIPGVLQGLRRLQEAGYRVVVVTNQAGIGLGYFRTEDFYRVNRVLLKEATAAGLRFDRIYFCPHGVSDGCRCRKPLPGMLLRAHDELNVRLDGSWMIGDSTVDIEAGKAAGCKTALFRSSPGREAEVSGADLIATDFTEIVAHILSARA